MIYSMSKKSDCYDNASIESWNHSFKVEAVHSERLKTRTAAKQHIFKYYRSVGFIPRWVIYLFPEAFELKQIS